jgi:hypothetical protein
LADFWIDQRNWIPEAGFSMIHRWSAFGGPNLAAHTRFHSIEFVDPPQGLGCRRRAGRLGHLVELASCMRHSIAGQLLESRVTINVQDAIKVREMRYRSLCFPVRRGQEGRRKPTSKSASAPRSRNGSD